MRLSRELICSIWERSQQGLPLSEEEQHIADALGEHEHYREAWQEGRLLDRDYTIDDVNPFLHVHIHVTVENQLRNGDPPEVGAALEELQRRGISRHEAIHMIGSVQINEIYEIMSKRRPFNRARYLKELDKLVRAENKKRI